MRTLTALLILNLSLSLTAGTALESRSKVWKAQADTSPGGTLTIPDANWDIRIRSGSGDTIAVTASLSLKTNVSGYLEELFSEKRLSLTPSGDGFLLEMPIPSPEKKGFLGRITGRGVHFSRSIKVDITLPSEYSLDVKNAYGDIQIDDILGDHRLKNTSGEVVIRNGGGSIDLKNSYAPCEIHDFEGPVVVENTSGEIILENIGGSARVKNSYREVRAENIGGDFEFAGTSSQVNVTEVKGDIELKTAYKAAVVEDVEGRVRVENTSGEVMINGIVGNVEVLNSYRQVSIEGVQGDVEVEGNSSRIRVETVTGETRINTSYQGVEVEDIGGDVEIKSNSGAVDVDDVRGNLDIKSSYRGVTIRGTHGAIRVRGNSSSVRIEDIASMNGGEIDVETSYQPVRIDLPSNLSWNLDLEAPKNKIRANMTSSPDGIKVRVRNNAGVTVQED